MEKKSLNSCYLNSKATGLDNISVKFLKLSIHVIGDILTHIMNCSIKSGVFIDEWKDARVTPLYKSGEIFLVNNYRPVSVLPILSKIIERHIHNHFYEYLMHNNLITENQSGFRPKHSCETALHSIIEKWLHNIDNGKLTGVLFVDLSKAFDTVNHHVLLHKLLSFGICENSYNWFKSYLTNRSQCVRWNGSQSEKLDVTIGVPQGSILGPLFFMLYVNDYPNCLQHSAAHMYADDTSIYVIENKLLRDLKNTLEWMDKNKLTINLKKTQCMLIGTEQRLRKSRKLSLQVGDVFIENVSCAKLLGVYIDRCLTWSEHVEILSKKTCKQIRCVIKIAFYHVN